MTGTVWMKADAAAGAAVGVAEAGQVSGAWRIDIDR